MKELMLKTKQSLTLFCIMFQNGPTLQNLEVFAARFFKVCLNIP